MAKTETTAPSGGKRPRKAVLIRLAIYVPLLAFFGWRAGARAIDERKAADAAFRTDVGVWLESPPGMVDLSGAIPVHGEASMSAPPTEETETGGTDDTTGGDTLGTGSDTETTSGTETTGPETTSDTGTTGGDTTGDAGELPPVPAPTPPP